MVSPSKMTSVLAVAAAVPVASIRFKMNDPLAKYRKNDALLPYIKQQQKIVKQRNIQDENQIKQLIALIAKWKLANAQIATLYENGADPTQKTDLSQNEEVLSKKIDDFVQEGTQKLEKIWLTEQILALENPEDKLPNSGFKHPGLQELQNMPISELKRNLTKIANRANWLLKRRYMRNLARSVTDLIRRLEYYEPWVTVPALSKHLPRMIAKMKKQIEEKEDEIQNQVQEEKEAGEQRRADFVRWVGRSVRCGSIRPLRWELAELNPAKLNALDGELSKLWRESKTIWLKKDRAKEVLLHMLPYQGIEKQLSFLLALWMGQKISNRRAISLGAVKSQHIRYSNTYPLTVDKKTMNVNRTEAIDELLKVEGFAQFVLDLDMKGEEDSPEIEYSDSDDLEVKEMRKEYSKDSIPNKPLQEETKFKGLPKCQGMPSSEKGEEDSPEIEYSDSDDEEE